MSTSNPSEINAQKPAVPTVKKDAQSSGSAESSVPSKSLPLVESRCYGVSVGVGVSSALVAYGIAADLYVAGSIFGLPVEQQKNVEIFAADHVSASNLKFQVSRFVDGEANISVIVPKTPTPPDYRSQEGRALMGPPKAEGCHVVVVPAASKKARWSEGFLLGFCRSRDGVCAMLFTTHIHLVARLHDDEQRHRCKHDKSNHQLPHACLQSFDVVANGCNFHALIAIH